MANETFFYHIYLKYLDTYRPNQTVLSPDQLAPEGF